MRKQPMTIYDFIFTKTKPQKYYRHIIFWVAQFLFWAFIVTGFFNKFNTEYLLFQLALHSYFVLDTAYTYTIIYYILPKYFITRQYTKLSIAIFILSLSTYVLFVFHHLWHFNIFKESQDQQLLMSWYFTMNFIIFGPPVICAMFLTCKMLKNYYIKMEEKQKLIKETAIAEMQLLKAQVHPHFLFNTLNNIYSFALNKSPEAGNLVLKLKDTTRYMVYECDTALVPLQKEIKMLVDYLEIEKVRYGKRLKIEINIDGGCESKMVTPLLMIPFVENSFKHGASKMLRQPWIHLSIQADEDILHFIMANNKPADKLVNSKKGIGLSNVKKRLELLYPQNHLLTIDSTENTFTINMQIPLEKMQKVL